MEQEIEDKVNEESRKLIEAQVERDKTTKVELDTRLLEINASVREKEDELYVPPSILEAD